VVDRYFPGLPTDAVIFDDFAIGYEVTSAMLDRGHRYPAMLWSESDATSVRDLSPLAVVSARLPRGKWDGRPRA
jgi:DNA-binding LacI/PurR family transcriptional regulator